MESYRTRNDLTYRQLGERLNLGLPVSQVRRIALGLSWPRPATVNAIILGSDCEITVDSMHRLYSDRQSCAA